MRNYKKKIIQKLSQLHIAYLVIVLLVGTAFVIFTPPFYGPDEEQHYFRAYQLSRGDLIMDRLGDSRLSSCITEEVFDSFVDTSLKPNIRGQLSEKYDLSKVSSAIGDTVDNVDNCEEVDTTNTYSYNPLIYAPSIVAMWLSSLFKVSPLMSLYLARFFTLAVTAAIISLSIKILPKRKYALFIIALIPTLVFQQTVISADGISYAILMLLIAYVIKLYNSANITKRQWVILSIVAVLTVVMKPPLFIFASIVLILLNKNKIIPLVIVGAVFILFLISSLLVSFTYPNVESIGTEGSSTAGQIENLIDNPFRAIQVAWYTYTGPFVDSQSLGVLGSLGTSDVIIPVWLYTIAAINLAFIITLIPKQELLKGLSRKYITLIYMLMAIYFAGVHGAMYVTYSPVDFDIIYGVQGRYFIPLIMLIPLLLTVGVRVSGKDYIKIAKYTTITAVLILLMSLVLLIQRYYFETP